MSEDATRTDRSTAAFIGQQLIAAQHRYTHALEVALRQEWGRFPLTVPQLRTLREVAAHPASSGATLARALDLTPQTLTTVLRNLEVAGWIERTSAPGDGRTFKATLTATGKATLARAERAVQAVNAALLDAVGHDAHRPASDHLDRILAAFAPEPFIPRVPKPRRVSDMSRLDEAMVAQAMERHSQGTTLTQIRSELVYPTGSRAGLHPSMMTLRKAMEQAVLRQRASRAA